MGGYDPEVMPTVDDGGPASISDDLDWRVEAYQTTFDVLPRYCGTLISPCDLTPISSARINSAATSSASGSLTPNEMKTSVYQFFGSERVPDTGHR